MNLRRVHSSNFTKVTVSPTMPAVIIHRCRCSRASNPLMSAFSSARTWAISVRTWAMSVWTSAMSGFSSNVATDCFADGRYDGFGQWFRGARFAERLDGPVCIEGKHGHRRYCTAASLGSSTDGYNVRPSVSSKPWRVSTPGGQAGNLRGTYGGDVHQSVGRGDQPLSVATCPQSRGLVSVGRGGVRQSQSRRQTHSVERGLLGLSLVSRHGARVVRRRGDGRAHERPLRQRQGGP